MTLAGAMQPLHLRAWLVPWLHVHGQLCKKSIWQTSLKNWAAQQAPMAKMDQQITKSVFFTSWRQETKASLIQTNKLNKILSSFLVYYRFVIQVLVHFSRAFMYKVRDYGQNTHAFTTTIFTREVFFQLISQSPLHPDDEACSIIFSVIYEGKRRSMGR